MSSGSRRYTRLVAKLLPWFRGGPFWETKEQAAQRRIASFWGTFPALVALAVVVAKVFAGPGFDQSPLTLYVDQGWVFIDAAGFLLLSAMVFMIESRGRAFTCFTAALVLASFDVGYFLESRALVDFSWASVAISGSIVVALLGLGWSDVRRAWAVYEEPQKIGARCHQCPHLFVTCCGVTSIGLVAKG